MSGSEIPSGASLVVSRHPGWASIAPALSAGVLAVKSCESLSFVVHVIACAYSKACKYTFVIICVCKHQGSPTPPAGFSNTSTPHMSHILYLCLPSYYYIVRDTIDVLSTSTRKQPLINDTIDLVEPMAFDRKALSEALQRRARKAGAGSGGRQQFLGDVQFRTGGGPSRRKSLGSAGLGSGLLAFGLRYLRLGPRTLLCRRRLGRLPSCLLPTCANGGFKPRAWQTQRSDVSCFLLPCLLIFAMSKCLMSTDA